MHYIFDYMHRRATVRLNVDSNAFWLWIGLDQFLHAMIYLIIGFTVTFLTADYI
jgi:hypothetical protein